METVFYFVCNIIHLMVFYAYVDKMLIRRFDKKTVCLMWVAFFIIDEVVVYFNKLEIINLLTMTILFMSLFLIGYKSGLKKAFAIYLFFSIFTLASEMLTMCIYAIVGIEPLEKYMLGSAISKIFTIVIIRIVLVIIHNRKIMNITIKLWLCILLIPLSSVALVIIWDLNIGIESSVVINIFALMLILIINFVAFYMFDDLLQVLALKNANEMLVMQREYYLNQCEQVQRLWDNMREFRHDIKNRYIHEKLLLEREEYSELRKQYDSNIEFVNTEKLFANSGNVYVDSIINYKLTIAEKMSAKINCELSIPDSFTDNYDDFVIILGNLMDNAIEALEKVRESEKVLSVKMIYDEPNLVIHISNNYEGEIKKGRNNEFITNKIHKNMHGIGLKSVGKIVEEYNGTVDIKTDNNIFDVVVYMIVK